MARTSEETQRLTDRSLELQRAMSKQEMIALAKKTTSSNGVDTVFYVMGNRATKADLAWELAQSGAKW